MILRRLVFALLISLHASFDLALNRQFKAVNLKGTYRQRSLPRLFSVHGKKAGKSNQDRLPAVFNVATQENVVERPAGLYIHWPFCRRRCRYCDFAIVPIGTKDRNETEPSLLDRNYTQSLMKELHAAEKQFSASPLRIQSIYFGGGTPSLAPLECLSTIIDFIQNSNAFLLADNCETTIEVDPGTFTMQKLDKLKKLGFNRLSFGVQSFDDEILELIGRTHRHADIESSLEAIRRVFPGKDELNWSIDLISGLPGVSCAKWIETLDLAVSMRPQPTHISVYDLQVEQGTVFGNWYRSDDANHLLLKPARPPSSGRLPTHEDAAFMYKFASGYLRAYNYEHYEVSSYALRLSNGTCFRSKHNQIYWTTDGQWLAFGMGASGYMSGVFTVRPRQLSNYLDWANSLPTTDMCTTTRINAPSDMFERLTDIVLKRLRTSEGLDLFDVRDRFGESFCEAILRGSALALELNLATFDIVTGSLKLKDPDGFLFSNTIIASVFVELELAVKGTCLKETPD